ncbi:MAG: hypothetical protein PHE18_05025 [Candidatus Omnitrophica bacterium]|nr:hypothetical protein [Candidatus Omnitrophota bacterium]MDD5553220.1 hypothetical protein [Candidatus Omnitrophota bacterium]
MAEEIKQEEKKTDSKKLFWTAFKVILGLVFLVLGIAAVIRWFWALKIVFEGCIGLFLILAGIITLAIAKE